MANAYADLAVDLSDEELARDWSLSAADLDEVRRCRGDSNRHRFAVQLCAMRALGHFIDDVCEVPVRITNHVGRQIGRPPVLFIEPAERRATTHEHADRLRSYLGFQPFDEERLKQWLDETAAEGIVGDALLDAALRTLRAWKVEAPARSTLDRLVRSASARSEEAVWSLLYSRMSPEFCASIDGLLAVTDRKSTLFELKQYPPDAKPGPIRKYLERVELLRTIGARGLDFTGVDSATVIRLAGLVRRWDVDDLRRFAPAKRYSLVACFLVEAQKTILDHVVEMHRVFMLGMARRARGAVDDRHRAVRQRATEGLEVLLRAMDVILDDATAPAARIDELYRRVDEDSLRAAVNTCRELHAIGDQGFVDELLARHSNLKQYLPMFLALPFCAAPGAENLLAAIDLARRLGPGERLPDEAPAAFAKGLWHRELNTWRAELHRRARRDRRVWEIAIAFALRDALRSGDVYLEESRHHVSFWNLVHDADRWERERPTAYADLELPFEAAPALDGLRADFDAAVGRLADGLDDNPFASLVDGQLAYSRDDGDQEPASVGELRRVIETRLPRIRIEDLLVEVDRWCGFTRELVPLGGYQPRVENAYPATLAALVAHGTNLGLATMAQSTKGITVDVLHHQTKCYLHPEALKAANRRLVDYHHALPIASAWGDGSMSSSDGQRFGVQAPSLLASFYPRYFGYYDRAVTVYTHVSDQFSVFGTRVISCGTREALHVLDALLENDTVLRPREHTTDTHGFTEQLFGLCHLLGFSFMPRLADLKDQKLYRLGAPHRLASIFRGTIDVALIAEQWDQLVRIASSLRSRTTPAHVVLDRLAGNSTDRLSKALTMLGRAVKTIHVLRYVQDAQLRARIGRQLNRGESRHALAKRLFFANQGAFRRGDRDEIMNKSTALSVLSNAVLVWNSVQFAKIIEGLEGSTGDAVELADLARISPLASAHVIPSGTYRFPKAARGLE